MSTCGCNDNKPLYGNAVSPSIDACNYKGKYFSDAQINEILEAVFHATGHTTYIGARYVPIFGRKDEDSIIWDNSKPYEPLTIVLYEGNSFTSRQFVPAGIDINSKEFWAETGNYNAQVEQYRQEVLNIKDEYDSIDARLETVEDTLDDFGNANKRIINVLNPPSKYKALIPNDSTAGATNSKNLQEMIDDFEDLSGYYNGAVIIFPDSEFYFDNEIRFVKGCITLTGVNERGTKLRYTGSGDFIRIDGNGYQVDNIVIKDLSLFGVTAHNGNVGIHASDFIRLFVQRVLIFYFDDGIKLDLHETTTSGSSRFEDVSFGYPDSTKNFVGFRMNGNVNAIHINRCGGSFNKLGHFILSNDATDIWVNEANCAFTYNAVTFTGGSGDNRVTNSVFDTCTGYAIRFIDCEKWGNTVSNCWCLNVAGATQVYMIQSTRSKGVKIMGCQIGNSALSSANTCSGILFSGSAYGLATNNTFENNVKVCTNVDSSQNIVIANNVNSDNAKLEKIIFVNVNNTSDQVVVSGNSVTVDDAGYFMSGNVRSSQCLAIGNACNSAINKGATPTEYGNLVKN